MRRVQGSRKVRYGKRVAKIQHKITKAREEARIAHMVEQVKSECNGSNFGDVSQHVMTFLSTDAFSRQFVVMPGLPLHMTPV